MNTISRNSFKVIVVTLCYVWTSSDCSIYAQTVCPIGFQQIKYWDLSYCYRLKGPEKYEDKDENCIRNQYSLDILKSSNISKPGLLFWADYKTLYPGGLFVEENTGNVLPKVSKFRSDLDIDQDYCAVWNSSTGELRVATCDEAYYRYCITIMKNSDGFDNQDVRFESPRPAQLFRIDNVRATWAQAQNLCNARGGTLLQKGWRYANHPDLSDEETVNVPLGIFMSLNDKLLWSQPEDGTAEVPDSEWSFQDESFSVDTSLVALIGESWHLVNNSSIFFNVICEMPVFLKDVQMIFIESNNKLIVTGIERTPAIEDSELFQFTCHTDSDIIVEDVFTNLTATQSTRIETDFYNLTSLVISTKSDGYYWCDNGYTSRYRLIGSNYLYIKDIQSVEYTFALKIRFKKKYTYEKLDLFMNIWMKKITEYLFLYNEYLKVYKSVNMSDPYALQDVLKRFNKTINTVILDERSIFKSSVLKRIYLDKRTALIHIQLQANIQPLLPSHWENIEILFMRPTYHCRTPNSGRILILGQSYSVNDCRMFKCVGDFNEGVQLVETLTPDCQSPRRAVAEVFVSVRDDTTTTVSNELSTEEEIDSGEISTTTTDEPTTVYETTSYETTTDFAWDTVSTETLPPITLPTTELTTEALPTTTTPSPPIRPPQQQVDDVLNHLENLLNTSQIISVKDMDNAFDEVDELLSLTEQVEIPGNFLTMLDAMGARADLNGTNRMATVRQHVALLVAATEPNNPVRGLRLATRTNEAFKEEAFHLLSDRDNDTHLEVESSEAVVYLPESVAMSDKRISFVVFRDDRPFLPAPGFQHYTVNSRVLSINVENVTEFEHGEVIDIYLRPLEGEIDRNQSRSCGHWNFTEGGSSGSWSQEGCLFIPATKDGLLDTCRCTHLTHFAEVLVPRTVFPIRHESALEYLSVVGCSLSLFGLGMIGLTAMLFRSWRRDFNNKIWLNLCVAITLLIVAFLVVAFSDFQHYSLPCMFTGIILHYSVISSFCWMLVAAVISYRRLVLVFTRDASHKLLRACAFAYGTPFAIFGLLLSIDPLAYAGRFEETMPSGTFCYPSGLALWLTVYVPVAMMLLANCTLFALIVRSVFATKQIQRHGDANEAIRCASVSCLLVFLFGLPWVFGLFANLLVFAYLFTLTATFQGFVLFLFFVIGNKKTRELWMNKLKIKQTRKVPVSSSTGYRGGGTVTIEASSSKPRSLASTDDSRFS